MDCRYFFFVLDSIEQSFVILHQILHAPTNILLYYGSNAQIVRVLTFNSVLNNEWESVGLKKLKIGLIRYIIKTYFRKNERCDSQHSN